MDIIEKNNYINWLNKKILEEKIPTLGICLGMQILAEKGLEGGEKKGLGYIPGEVIKLNNDKLRVPHQGWDDIQIINKYPLYEGIENNSSFYFVHSYYMNTEEKYISSYCDYGIKIPSSVQKDNIFGVQFHPEKSHKVGLSIIRNFYNYLRR